MADPEQRDIDWGTAEIRDATFRAFAGEGE
jgi:hypothetical protein